MLWICRGTDILVSMDTPQPRVLSYPLGPLGQGPTKYILGLIDLKPIRFGFSVLMGLNLTHELTFVMVTIFKG